MAYTDKKIKRVVLYTRVSSKIQIPGFSLDNQKDKLLEEVRSKKYTVVEHFEDAGISGKNTKIRPAFNRMMKLVAEKSKSNDSIDAILVYKLSRFSRSLRDLANNLDILKEHDCHLISVDDGQSTLGKQNRAFMLMLGIFAEMERENIVDNAKDGMRKGALSGHWMGGVAPYGFKTVPKINNDTSTLAINEDEAKYVRIIFDMYAKGQGYSRIVRHLNDVLNIKTRKGNLFNYSLIQQMLDNPVYAGKIRYNRYEEWNRDLEENERKRKKSDKIVIVEGKHEAIIDTETWENVRSEREKRGGQRKKKRDGKHLLSGKVLCPQCGTPMVSNSSQRTNKDGTKVNNFYYMCGKYNNTRKCKPNLIRKDIVDEQFKTAMFEIAKSPKLHDIIAEKLNKSLDIEEHQEVIERCEKEIEEYLRQEQKYKDEFIQNRKGQGIFSDEELRENIMELQRMIEKNKQLIKTNQSRITIKENDFKISEDISKLMQNFEAIFEASELELQRELIKYLVHSIEVHDSKNNIERSQIKSMKLQFNGDEIATLGFENEDNENVLLKDGAVNRIISNGKNL